jgi:hypothetical protein
MTDKEIQKILENILKNAKKAYRQCLFDDCKDPSIESHLLQKRGIINQIAENNHVMELGIDSFKEDMFYFKRIGINDAFAFPGFCKRHDDAVFKEIESGKIDYYDYRTQLLFSYRAVMNEKRKKEIQVDFYERILKSITLNSELNEEYFDNARESLTGLKAGINDERYYEPYFLSNIKDSTLRDFSFLTFELPRIEICSSAVFTYETTADFNHMMLYEPHKLHEPLTEIYFNILPVEDKSFVIMGCLNERVEKCWNYIESFKAESYEKSLKKISDVLLCLVENWLCSESMYKNNLKMREKDIVRITHESIAHHDERRELDYNMFDSI